MKKAWKKDNKMILWFEIDDTGCGMNLKKYLKNYKKNSSIYIVFLTMFFCLSAGIDPGKWESVFESFEQADPSTTRL